MRVAHEPNKSYKSCICDLRGEFQQRRVGKESSLFRTSIKRGFWGTRFAAGISCLSMVNNNALVPLLLHSLSMNKWIKVVWDELLKQISCWHLLPREECLPQTTWGAVPGLAWILGRGCVQSNSSREQKTPVFVTPEWQISIEMILRSRRKTATC